MIRETGRVIALEGDGLWVETIQRSACDACAVQKGCGQGALARFAGKSAAIRVLPGICDIDGLCPDDQVVIGIPEDVLVRGTLIIYLLPLLSLVVGAALAASVSMTDAVVGVGAILGLTAGGLVARLHSALNKNNRRIQPVLLERVPLAGV